MHPMLCLISNSTRDRANTKPNNMRIFLPEQKKNPSTISMAACCVHCYRAMSIGSATGYTPVSHCKNILSTKVYNPLRAFNSFNPRMYVCLFCMFLLLTVTRNYTLYATAWQNCCCMFFLLLLLLRYCIHTYLRVKGCFYTRKEQISVPAIKVITNTIFVVVI